MQLNQHSIKILRQKLEGVHFKIEAVAGHQYRRYAELSAHCNQSPGYFSVHYFSAHSLEDTLVYFVALLQDAPVGTLKITNAPLKAGRVKTLINFDRALEVSVYLLPRYHRRAFCAALMACVYGYAKHHDIQHIFTFSDDPFFERIGFETFAEYPLRLQKLKPDGLHLKMRVMALARASPLLEDLAHQLTTAGILPKLVETSLRP